ncbi:MAG: hypothetical protein C4560_09845 [Nitrospiraceae bacterium]|nr:MAG: hypothetical protein C4560_09845 [Nitrospiraceae bacterium]
MVKLKIPVFLIMFGLLITTQANTAETIECETQTLNKIVFRSDRAEYEGDVIRDDNVYMMNQDGTELVQLTNNQAEDRDSSLSPVKTSNRNKIAFSSNREGNWNIYLMEIEGEISGPPAQRVTLCPPFCDSDQEQPDWAPDGEGVVFQSNIAGSKDIYTMKLDGTNLLRLTNSPYDDQGPQWSPDGNKIAYVNDHFGNRDIWIIEKLKDKWGKIRRLTCETGDDANPSWHPDEGSILYGAFEMGKAHIIKITNAGNCSCDNIDYNSCQTEQLTWGNFFDRSPVYSPNGRSIAFSSNRFDNFDIWRMKGNGKRMIPLTINTGYDSGPDWGKVKVPVVP